MIRRWWYGRKRKVRCSECFRKGVREWHQETPTMKRGGRWCPHCGYGVHPPDELAEAA